MQLINLRYTVENSQLLHASGSVLLVVARNFRCFSARHIYLDTSSNRSKQLETLGQVT